MTRPYGASSRASAAGAAACAALLAAAVVLAGGSADAAGPLPDCGEIAPDAPGQFALRDGDRVVFYGDSITQEGGYARLVEEFVATRFPGWDVRFYNAGVGGDTVAGGWAGDAAERLRRDVVDLQPTVVTIMLGMNDGGYKPYDAETFGAYAEGYRSIVSILKKELPGVRLTLIRPSPFDDVTRAPGFEPGYDDVLRRFGCYVTALAARERVEVVDFHTPLNRGLESVLPSDTALARQLLPDRVHPSDAGHLVLGAALLRAWGAPPLVSRVEIDAASPGVTAAENCQISGLESVDGVVRWTQTDRALPLPLNFEDADVALAEAAGAGLVGLDQQGLAVSGLGPGEFELRIDGTPVGTFPAEALARGVNLATHGTPMRWQAYRARWSAGDRHELQRVRRRLLASDGDRGDAREAARTLAALDEEEQSQRAEATKPQPRRYEIALAPARATVLGPADREE